VSQPTHPVVELYRRFWDDPKPGDSEDAVAARERALGVTLPAGLRALYRHTAFRNSELLHLRELSRVAFEGDVLLFADEQQGCAFWGIRRKDLGQDNPPLVFGTPGRFEPDDCALNPFLLGLLLINRTYEPPCARELPLPAELPGWEKVKVHSRALGNAPLWVKGDAVAQPNDVFGMVGARTNDGLRAALADLGEDVDADLVEFADGPRNMPSDAERVAAFHEHENQLWLVPPELLPIVGEGPVRKGTVFIGLELYLRSCGRRSEPSMALDEVLARATGRQGPLPYTKLVQALTERLVTPAPPGAVEKSPLPRDDSKPGGLWSWLGGAKSDD
jgi:hypothetical protein